ncbi:DUF72 domain-containing protein [Pseudoxanthomonas indica]|uniref:Uncharacterized conserved protein YecE, DUF72 family n=1 Tax=Pseudoxanthomonas indica TaxID=428993 RepID=A0A1T5LQD4_9GAMM|nr:DUF72 domain-containing protein [Pseudoxanthomonas indica]SKC77748.1 Uncharacterized conserved protein YecE, DUF72 family [Pseudoxanthomonas indica]
MTPARSRPPTGAGAIHVGVGGWVYAPWRDNFYPAGLVQRLELEYASRQLTAIEINGTYYGAQKPATYAKWREQTPPGFVFSAKAPMRIVQARVLAKTGKQVEDFVGGIAELGDRLGPLVWQFEGQGRLQREDFAAFLALLPRSAGGRHLRHVLDVRDAAFANADLIALARQHEVATVFTDAAEHPNFADLGTDFVYARLMRTQASRATGYTAQALAGWADIARRWAHGEDPPGLPHLLEPLKKAAPREVYVYFINGAKERNPAAAMALLAALGKR